MARTQLFLTLDDLKRKVKEGYKIKSLNLETRRIELLSNEQMGQNKDDIYKTSLKCSDEELREFVASPYYDRSQMKVHERGIVLIDLAEFSRLSNDAQVRLITRFQYYIHHLIEGHQEIVESALSTGDGYFIIFKAEGFHSMLRFVMRLVQQLTFYNFEGVGANKFYFRIAINIGVVHYFYDINDRWNYVGDGMNDAKRIIDLIPHEKENGIFLAECVYNLHKEESFKFLPLQTGHDKHKKPHRYVEVAYQHI